MTQERLPRVVVGMLSSKEPGDVSWRRYGCRLSHSVTTMVLAVVEYTSGRQALSNESGVHGRHKHPLFSILRADSTRFDTLKTVRFLKRASNLSSSAGMAALGPSWNTDHFESFSCLQNKVSNRTWAEGN
jgi:hypothetical protein